VAKFQILMTDCIFPDQDIERRELAAIDAELTLARDTGEETLIREGKDCDAVLNVYAQVPANVIRSLRRCKVIVRTGIGVNTIDMDAADSMGIMVANVPDYCLDEVADHAMALFLALARKIVILDGTVRRSAWSLDDGRPIYRIGGSTFGLLGFGNIAQRVASRALSFGLRVIAFDPYLTDDVFALHGVERVDIGRLIEESDAVSLHAPLTEETRHIINAESLSKMKATAFVINTSRGPLVDEGALFSALQDGTIAGAGLDVLEDEPPTLPNSLLTLSNVIVTPHAAFYSEQSNVELRRKSAQEIVRALTVGKPLHWVNRPSTGS
jgi:D-3-phosphoglycerate dehydrogenase / 2-oxoglutarate reductase